MKKRGTSAKFRIKNKDPYESEIVFSFDGYNDIFSDFDPRPYAHKSLSSDFLDELKRASRDKPFSKIDLKLFVKKEKRNIRHEVIIEKRLKNHFNKHYNLLLKEKNNIMNKGTILTILGIMVMIIATSILFKYKNINLFTTFLVVLLEPGGWFLFWEGLDLVVFGTKDVKHELDFYKKMAGCNIIFYSY